MKDMDIEKNKKQNIPVLQNPSVLRFAFGLCIVVTTILMLLRANGLYVLAVILLAVCVAVQMVRVFIAARYKLHAVFMQSGEKLGLAVDPAPFQHP